jgi:hypothetical protein
MLFDGVADTEQSLFPLNQNVGIVDDDSLAVVDARLDSYVGMNGSAPDIARIAISIVTDESNHEIQRTDILSSVVRDQPAAGHDVGIVRASLSVGHFIHIGEGVSSFTIDVDVMDLDDVTFGHVMTVDQSRHLESESFGVMIVLKDGGLDFGLVRDSSSFAVDYKVFVGVDNTMCVRHTSTYLSVLSML